MAEKLKRAAAWLGLVTDDRYADYDDADANERTEGISREELLGAQEKQPASVTPLETRRTTPPAASGSTPVPIQGAAPAPAPTPRTADVTRIITVHPRTYNEARTIGEHYRDGVPVIMNLTEMEDVDAKRLVDFAAGLIFGLRGTIERVTSKVFLLSPQNVTVTAEDKERIAAGSFFNQS
ncbi:cell division protein SepF [Microlunatus capsulatus]|uniref:Cell division protein SepF n=1 Tax=Microlunatus capsulatus TaxID=99117 RepID=A0ABS4ZBG4_9ACTN|nr:cell division protein SepF [Microlunatus capsulatus]MBP2418403.1 cell division inhibitor SepF [Microlunatus capsulatus]